MNARPENEFSGITHRVKHTPARSRGTYERNSRGSEARRRECFAFFSRNVRIRAFRILSPGMAQFFTLYQRAEHPVERVASSLSRPTIT